MRYLKIVLVYFVTASFLSATAFLSIDLVTGQKSRIVAAELSANAGFDKTFTLDIENVVQTFDCAATYILDNPDVGAIAGEDCDADGTDCIYCRGTGQIFDILQQASDTGAQNIDYDAACGLVMRGGCVYDGGIGEYICDSVQTTYICGEFQSGVSQSIYPVIPPGP